MPDCLFCQLIQTKDSILFADEHLIVVHDINPQAPIHQLIIPKKHIATLNDLTEKENWLVGHLFYIAKQQAAQYEIDQAGFRAVFNCNEAGGQAVYHIHLHLLGGRVLQWPPG
jgi:histidine triad (HIT) family protein